MEKLQEMQLRFKTIMFRLEAIKAMKTLTDTIRAERDALLKEAEPLADDIEKEQRRLHLEIRDRPPEARFLMEGVDLDPFSKAEQSAGYALRRSNQKKDFRSLWGQAPLNTYRWNDKERGCSFYEAVFSGRHHPGLTTRSMIEGIGSEGGFLVPVEYAEQIHNVSLENELIMPRATVIPMKTETKKLPALDIGDHSSGLFGGFTASYSQEAGTLSQNNPKARQVDLSLKKLYGFLRFSNELFEDISGGGEQIAQICGKGLAWYRDKFFLTGAGGGQPLGVLNSPCVVEVAAETGQATDTIVYRNLLKMVSRLWGGSFLNSIWIAHPSTIPDLGTLTVDVGTGGAHIPVMKENNGQFSILTRPVVFSEKMEPIGDKGDIALVDLSQYVIGLREEMRIEFSPHVYFSSDEMACRLIERHDGCSLWDEALTLEDGSTTVSPFVVLAAR